MELSALLPLLGLPLEFTFWKLSELFGFGERSHQLFGDQGAPRKTGRTGISRDQRSKSPNWDAANEGPSRS